MKKRMLTVKHITTGEECKAFYDPETDKIVNANGEEYDWRDWCEHDPIPPQVIQAFALLSLIAVAILLVSSCNG